MDMPIAVTGFPLEAQDATTGGGFGYTKWSMHWGLSSQEVFCTIHGRNEIV